MDSPNPLAQRFRFVRQLRGTSKSLIWLAEELGTGKAFVASLLPHGRVDGLRKAVGLSHPHAARLVAIVDKFGDDELPGERPPGEPGSVVVAEHVPGRTLHQRIESRSVDIDRAIQMIARLARGLSAIHARGAVHGAVSPRSVIVTREELGVAPVLTHLLAPPNGAYCSPERVTGGGPSVADDTWALYATLYAALTGRPPFAGESRKDLARMIIAGRPVPLRALGVEDEALQAIIDRGLTSRSRERATSLGTFEADLLAGGRGRGAPRSMAPSDAPPSIARTISPPSVDDEGIQQAILNPRDPDAERPVSRHAMLAVREPVAAADAAPEIEVGSPSVDDHEDVLVALASQPPPSPGDAPLPIPRVPAPAPLAMDQLVFDTSRAAGTVDVDAGQRPRGASTPPPLPESTAGVGASEGTGTGTGTGTSARAVAGERVAASAAPAVASAPRSARGKRSRGVVVGVGVAGALAAAVAVAFALRSPAAPVAPMPSKVATAAAASTGTVPPPKPSPEPAPAPSAKPRALEAEKPASPPPDVGACVVSQFPAGTFRGTEGFEFVCDVADPRVVEKRIFSRIVQSGTGKLTEGMKIWARLGWYQLATVAVIRGGCCASRTPLDLPPSSEVCPAVATTLESLGRALKDGTDAKAIDAFHSTIACLFDKQVPRPYRHTRRADGSNRAAFEQLLEARASSRGGP